VVCLILYSIIECIDLVVIPQPLGYRALSDDARMMSVFLSHTSGLSLEQRGLGRLKLAQR